MDEASYEARKRPLESDLPEQIEVRVRRERRRWTPADKLRIVEAAFGKRELNCTFPGAGATTRLGCAKGMASSEDGRGVV